MTREVLESDWKVFRELRDVALQRYCERVCDDFDRVRHDGSKTYHERYLDIFDLLQDRNTEMARVFNNPKRSAMYRQLALLQVLDLIEPGEFERFTPATREHVQLLPKEVLD